MTRMAARTSSHTIAHAEQRYEARSTESFDRIAYAMALLRVLKPHMTVAVYPRRRQLQVERGREPGTNEPWALVGIPPHATRENIASALCELSGVAGEPFVVDLLGSSAAEVLG